MTKQKAKCQTEDRLISQPKAETQQEAMLVLSKGSQLSQGRAFPIKKKSLPASVAHNCNPGH
jgi:hypothetical protein